MTEAGGDNSNGRVTLAIIGTKIDHILDRLDRIERRLDAFDQRMLCDEIAAQNRETRLKQVEDETQRLNAKSNIFDGVNGMLAVIAGLVGWFR